MRGRSRDRILGVKSRHSKTRYEAGLLTQSWWIWPVVQADGSTRASMELDEMEVCAGSCSGWMDDYIEPCYMAVRGQLSMWRKQSVLVTKTIV